MSTDARDPILRGLDALADLADGDPVADRMAGITRRARANRNRRVAAVAATLAVVAVVAVVAGGVVGAQQLFPDDDRATRPDPAPSPPAATLAVDLTVDRVGLTRLRVSYRIHGTAHEWTTGDGEPYGESGPRYTRLLLDGEEVSGSDGGDAHCRPGAPELSYDATWSGDNGLGEVVDVPGPGTYEVTVDAPYCGADGEVVPLQVSQAVTVDEVALEVLDETTADLDGDGADDTVRVMAPSSEGGQLSAAEVTLAAGGTATLSLNGNGVPSVGGVGDQNGDGRDEVGIVSEGDDHSWWTLLTFHRGDVVAAEPILSGGEWVATPETGAMEHAYAGEVFKDFQVTWWRDGKLYTWLALREWDQQSNAKVTSYSWALEGREMSLGGDRQEVCVTPDPSTWTDPTPC